jgi:predicted dehydrogenase
MERAAPAMLVISVPPHLHLAYMREALAHGLPFFVEASVTDDGLEAVIAEARHRGVFAAPSCTMVYHPAIRLVEGLLREGALGRISNVVYHMGNYLPDWHPYEAVSEFYASRKETGGAREIVPFDLTWLTRLFGFPVQVCGIHRKTIEIPGAPDIDDTYNAILDHGRFAMVLTIDVVSRQATRRLLVNGSERELVWDWDEQCVRIFHPDRQEWERIGYEAAPAAAGYNKNITEGMYIEEMRAFLSGIDDPSAFANTLEMDHRVLKLLYAIERAWEEGRWLKV